MSLFLRFSAKSSDGGGGGGGRFFLPCKDFARRVDDSFPACAFFPKGHVSDCAHQFHSLGKAQSTKVQQAEMTVAECSLHMSSFP